MTGNAATDLSSESDAVHLDLPVALSGDGQVSEIAGVVLGIAPPENQLPTFLAGRIPVIQDITIGMLFVLPQTSTCLQTAQHTDNCAPYLFK